MKVGDPLRLQFYCKQNCDQTDMDFYWRVVASHETSPLNSQVEKSDNQDWCSFRRGDDFPASLLDPYPQNYQPPPVFERSTTAAAHTSVSVLLLVATALLGAVAALVL